MKIVATALALVVLQSAPAVARTVDITAPGVTIDRGDRGVLQADLVCDPPRVGITLETRARLDLNGHELDGCSVAASVSDVRSIRVFGPGTIRNASVDLGPGRLTIRDVTIADPPSIGIRGTFSAFEPRSKVKARNLVMTGAALSHIRASDVRLRNVAVSGATYAGIEAGTVRGREVTSTGNGSYGVLAAGGKVGLTTVTLDGNGCAGVLAQKVRLKGGQALGNDTLAAGCADVMSGYAPRLPRVDCGTSSDLNVPSSSWNVCAGD